MNKLKAGFARTDITPMMGIKIAGYYIERLADGVLDPLQVNAVALSCDDEKVVLISVDNCMIGTAITDEYRKKVSEATGIPFEAIYIHATHTHQGPFLDDNPTDELLKQYYIEVGQKVTDAAVFAVEDLKPAKLGIGIGQAPGISFVRRYRMKDGTVETNPGVWNPNIAEPIGTPDERVNVLRFKREDAGDIVLVNFGLHPDVVGGCKISADWPGFLRRTVERVLPGTNCLFFNGAQGDVNHVNVFPKGGDFNDLAEDFDDVSRGYGHSRHMGNVVTGAVLQVFDKVEWLDVDKLSYIRKAVHVKSNMPSPEDDMEEAYRIEKIHRAGKDDELPYKGMMLTTVVAEAERRILLEHGPEDITIYLSIISIGDIAFVGVPGEPFTGIGRGLKSAEGWRMVLPTCLTNGSASLTDGSECYFPMKEAYDEGGYEARSSIFKAGVAEAIIESGLEALKGLRAE